MLRKLWAAALGLSAVGVASLALVLPGCSSRPPKQPNATRPLDQVEAIGHIAAAIREEGETAAGARPIALPRAQQLMADVTVSGRRFAIAYVTVDERRTLGNNVPPHDVGSNALQLVRDVNDRETRVLVLHDLNYMTDEQSGDEREVSSVVVERRLQRDVRDFVAEARRQGWP